MTRPQQAVARTSNGSRSSQPLGDRPTERSCIAAPQIPAGRAGGRFSPLHEAKIAIQLMDQDIPRILQGVGNYSHDPHLGGVLGITVTDDCGSYEFLFVENQWSGTVESGAAQGCAFLMRVG